jgi:hypothetical protein
VLHQSELAEVRMTGCTDACASGTVFMQVPTILFVLSGSVDH